MKNYQKGVHRGSARKRKKIIKKIFICGISVLFLIIVVYTFYEYRKGKSANFYKREHTYEYKLGITLKDFFHVNGYPQKIAGYENAETKVHHLFYTKTACFHIFTFKDNRLVEVLQGFHSEMLVQILLQHWRCHDRCSLPGSENCSKLGSER